MPLRPGAGSPSTPAGRALSAAALETPHAPALDGSTAVGVEMDGALRAQRDAPIGGQAVLEGVMMRGVRNWAVAVRKPSAAELLDGARTPEDGASGAIEVSTFPLRSAARRHRVLRLPVIRGVVALGGSLAIGFRALEISAAAQLPPADPDAAVARNGAAPHAGGEGAEAQASGEEIPRAVWAGTVVIAIVLAVGLFFLLPVGLTSLIKGQLGSSVLFWLVEGIVRTSIFLLYMLALSRVRDLRRVFEYHGAEHKTISCYEAGLPLTPANCQRFSRLHPRCGTSFLLLVMVVAIFVFAPIGLPAWYWLVATRILGVPLIAGLSFELIKLAGRNRDRGWVRALMWPGMKLQLLTTREPDVSQLEVAIAALRAVLALETPGELTAEDLVGVEVVA
jgi:uncharacterized protein YqhQ